VWGQPPRGRVNRAKRPERRNAASHNRRATARHLPRAARSARGGDAAGTVVRVGDKIFALERPWREWLALWCKVPQGAREIIIDSEPARFFVPPYFGAKGWIGVGLDEAADWREVEAFVRRSYRLVAPKRLAGLVG
jgi:predicted DNA-binding protein (MmcQ/YjbR family)